MRHFNQTMYRPLKCAHKTRPTTRQDQQMTNKQMCNIVGAEEALANLRVNTDHPLLAPLSHIYYKPNCLSTPIQ